MNTDKERILTIVSAVIERSRLHAEPHRRLTRGLLLQRMNQRRPSYAQMSRDEFQNYFTTRPDRKSVIPVEDIVCLVEVILQDSPESITASEVLALCDAARLPLREYRRLSRFFSIVEWNNAWRAYDAAKLNAHPEDFSFIGRDGLVTQVLARINAQHAVLLSGVSGIGKTQLALRICAVLEEDGHRVAMLDGRTIRDVESFVSQMCRVLDVVPLGNESALQRLQYYLQHQDLVVFIDDLLLATAKDTCGFLAYLRGLLPNVRTIATTVQQITATECPDSVHVYEVPGLDFEQSVLLFRHICLQLGFLPRENQVVHAQLAQCMGNPMAIKLIAYMLSSNIERIEYDIPLQRVLTTLSQSEDQVLRTLYEFDGYISIALLYRVAFPRDVDEPTAFAIINMLIAKGLVLMREYTYVTIHALVRVWFRNFMSDADSMRTTLLQRLSAIQNDNERYGNWLTGIQRNDIYLVLQCIGTALQHPRSQSIATHVLYGWRQYWLTARYTTEVLQFVELHRVVDRDDGVMLSLLQASLLRYDGQYAQARELLTTLEISGTLKNDMTIVAKAKHEMAMVHLNTQNRSVFEMYIQQAETLFSALQMENWLAQIAVDRATAWVTHGESAQALQWCLQAMHHQKRAEDSTLLIDAQLYHVKLLAYAQSFQIELGFEAYQHAKVCYGQLQMPQKLFHIEVGRMLLWIQAEQYSEAYATYEHILRIIPKSMYAEQVLWFADVVVVYLFEVRAFDAAFELSYLLNRMRNMLQLPQPTFLYAMIEQRKKSYEVEMMSAFSIRTVITQEISMHEFLAYIRRAMQESHATVTK